MKISSTGRLVAFLGFGLIAFWAACSSHPQAARESGSQLAKKEPAPAAGEVGAPMPEFTLKDTAGHDVSSAQFRGNVLLVDFWATWCEPCKREMPGYEDFRKRFAARGFDVVGLALDEDPVEVEKFGKTLGVHYPLLMSTPGVREQFGLLGIPMTLIVDRRGIIRYKVVGFEYQEKVEAALQKLL